MARRIKPETKTIKVSSSNPLLRTIERMQQHRINLADGIEDESESEREEREERMRQSADEIASLHKTFPRSKWVQEIGEITGAGSIETAWASTWMSDEELEQAARAARSIYKDMEVSLHFDSSLSREQVKTLLPVLNDLIFAEKQSIDDVCRLLACQHEKPVRVKSNALLSYTFNLLSRQKAICQNWMKVATERQCFVGERGKILKRKTLSSAPTKYCYARGIDTNGVLNVEIYNAIKEVFLTK